MSVQKHMPSEKLKTAVTAKDLSAVKLAFSEGANGAYHNGYALRTAVENNLIAIVQYLVEEQKLTLSFPDKTIGNVVVLHQDASKDMLTLLHGYSVSEQFKSQISFNVSWKLKNTAESEDLKAHLTALSKTTQPLTFVQKAQESKAAVIAM